MDAVATPKTCDPWAVYGAKKTMSQDMSLTAEQQGIFDLIKIKGPLTLEQICADPVISEGEFRNPEAYGTGKGLQDGGTGLLYSVR